MLDIRTNSPGQIEQTAGHEAAHVIVARRLGCNVRSVQIGLDPKQGDGVVGFAEIDFSDVDLVGQAAIKMAGNLWEDMYGDLREARDRTGPGSDLRWILGHCDTLTRREARATAVRILKSERVPLTVLQHDLIKRQRIVFDTASASTGQRSAPISAPQQRTGFGRDHW
jgi:hypothetical protein